MKYYLGLLVTSILFFGCDKSNDPSFDSIEGEWTYFSPDNKISISFQLVPTSSTDYKITNVSIDCEGIKYTSNGTGDITAPCYITKGPSYPGTIESIAFQRVSTVYEYEIALYTISPNNRFSEMNVAKIYYNYWKDNSPHIKTINDLSKIYRK